MNILKNLKVWQKLALLGVLFLIPFAAVTYTMVSSINSEKVRFAQLELLGTQYDAPLTVLLKALRPAHCNMLTMPSRLATMPSAAPNRYDRYL